MRKLAGFTGVIFIVFLIFCPCAGSGVLGDINNDGKVDTVEAIYSLQVSAGVYPSVPASCLLNGRGNWTSDIGYVVCDVVTFDEKQYVCKTTHSSTGSLESDSDYWELLVLKGEKGDTGDTGSQGLKGDKGDKGDTGVGTPSGYSILGDTITPPEGYTYSGMTVSVSGWRSRTYMNTGRDYGCSATVNGKIYVIGGYDYVNGTSDVVEEYDPSTDTWTAKQQMLASRQYHACAAVNNKIYIFGGRDSGYSNTKTTYVYDPVANSWTALADMPEVTFTSVAASANGKIYIIGGTMSAGILEYDPATNLWSTTLAQPPTLRDQGPSAIVANGRIYVIGGYLKGAGTNLSTKNESYDPIANAWNTHADIPVASMVNGVVRDGKILVVAIGSLQSRDIYVYDPVGDLWSSGPSMISSRTRPYVGIVNNSLYVIGGISDNAEQFGFEKYVHTKD